MKDFVSLSKLNPVVSSINMGTPPAFEMTFNGNSDPSSAFSYGLAAIWGENLLCKRSLDLVTN
jgi:hypothetical protein